MLLICQFFEIEMDIFMLIDLRAMLLFFIILGLLSPVALPPIPVAGFSFYLVTPIAFIVFILIFFCFLKKPVLHLSSVLPFFLGLMVIISAVVSWALGFSSPHRGDIMESIKYFQFVPYLLALPFIRSEKFLKYMQYSLISSSVWVLFVGFVQYFQLSGILDFILNLYLGPDSAHMNNVLSGKRITVTGSDPNIGAVLSFFYASFYFSLFLERKKTLFVLLFLCFVFLALMTQSRTALLAFLFAFFLWFVLFSKVNVVFKVILCALSLAGLVKIILMMDLQYLILGYQYTLAGENESFNVRLDNMRLAYERFSLFPLLGLGPAKSEFTTIIDSEYALIAQRYGLLGFFLFFSILFYFFLLAKKNIANCWGVILFMFTCMSVIVMVTNNIFSGYQLMSILILLNIACVALSRRECFFIK